MGPIFFLRDGHDAANLGDFYRSCCDKFFFFIECNIYSHVLVFTFSVTATSPSCDLNCPGVRFKAWKTGSCYGDVPNQNKQTPRNWWLEKAWKSIN